MAQNLSQIGSFVSDGLVRGMLIHSTKVESSNEIGEGLFIGFMHFVDGQMNWCRTLRFYKPTGVRIKKAVLHTKFLDYLGTGASQRVEDVNIYLNPTKTKVDVVGADYFRYSGGALLVDGYTPTVDEETIEHVLEVGELNSIQDGWNSIVAQCEVNDASDAKRGYVTMILILDTLASA